MFSRIQFGISSIAHFITVSTALSQIVLNQQCLRIHPLRTFEIHSLPDRVREYVSSTQYMFEDDISASVKVKEHAPWSYAPACTGVLQSIDDQLCIYTSTSFSNGRGISIFTTPAAAAQFASLPAFHNPSAFSDLDVNTNSGAWRASSLPGKGIGLIASRPLQFKDRITAYTPAFLAYSEIELSILEREAWWRQAIEQLPKRIKEEFLGLTVVYGDERVRVQDIVKANTFQVELGGVNHLAVFPETSRLNHGCNPK